MPYAPGVSSQAAQIIMGGHQMRQQSEQTLLNFAGWLQGRNDQAESTRTMLEAMLPATYPSANQGSDYDNGDGTNSQQDDQPHPAVQAGKQADALRNVMKAYAPDATDTHTALKAMSLPQLEGMMKSLTLQQTMDEHSARMQDYLAQAKLRDQSAQDDQTVGKFLKVMGSYTPPEGKTANPGDAIRFALSQVPDAGGRVLPKALDAAVKLQGLGQSTTPVPYESPNHNRFIQYGKSILPDNDKTTVQAKKVVDENGKHVGYMLGNQFKTVDDVEGLPKDAVLTPAKDDTGKPIPGLYRDKKSGKWVQPSKANPMEQLMQLFSGAAFGGKGAQGGSTNNDDPLGIR